MQRVVVRTRTPPGGRIEDDCPQKHSGNMPAARGARRAIALGMRSRHWAIMRGMTANSGRKTHPVGEKTPTPGGCMTCTGTCGSAARIGIMAVTHSSTRQMIQRGLQKAHSGCTGAGAGTGGQVLPVGGTRPGRLVESGPRHDGLPACLSSIGSMSKSSSKRAEPVRRPTNSAGGPDSSAIGVPSGTRGVGSRRPAAT